MQRRGPEVGWAALALLQCGSAELDWGGPGDCGLPSGRNRQAWPTWCRIRSSAAAAAASALHNL